MSTTYLNFTKCNVFLMSASPSSEHHPALHRSSCARSAHYPDRLRLNSDFVFCYWNKIWTRAVDRLEYSCRSTTAVVGMKWYRLELYPVIRNLYNFRVTIFFGWDTHRNGRASSRVWVCSYFKMLERHLFVTFAGGQKCSLKSFLRWYQKSMQNM
jgi:hypothetical protein